MRLDVAAVTNVGRLRDFNEDAFGITVPGGSAFRGPPRQRLALSGPVVLGVYDGLGHLPSGETGSGVVAHAVHEHFATCAFAPDQIAGAVSEAVRAAGRRLFELGARDVRYRGFGTTATVAAIWDGRLVVGHVGDTRAYLLRDAHLTQISRDDSLENELRDAGKADQLEMRWQNVITKALGINPDVPPSAYASDLEDGDLVMLCSDGVFKMIGEDALEKIVCDGADPEAICRNLVEAAERAGGQDNETAIAARCGPV